jgi:hypothetical protein
LSHREDVVFDGAVVEFVAFGVGGHRMLLIDRRPVERRIDEHDAQRMQFTDSTAMCGAASVIDDTVSHASCGDERLGCKRVVD